MILRVHSAHNQKPQTDRAAAAFTLIEVMIALGIFFMAVFTILALVSNTLRNARALQRPQVDSSMGVACYLDTNKFYVGNISGDFGDALSDYSWDAITDEFATNGLLIATVSLHHRGKDTDPPPLQVLVFDPNFQSTPFSGRR
jgi:hypothetical protein